jgi:hypothetical protein
LLGLALALFGLVFVARLGPADELAAVAVLYAVPIALMAVVLGPRWGLAAAGLGLLLFALWDQVEGVAASPLAYATLGLAFGLVGGLVGLLAERLRRGDATLPGGPEMAERERIGCAGRAGGREWPRSPSRRRARS